MTENPTKIQIIQRAPLLEDNKFYNMYNLFFLIEDTFNKVGHGIRFVKKKKEKKKFSLICFIPVISKCMSKCV